MRERSKIARGLLCAAALTLGCAPSLEGNEPREARREVPKSFRASGAAPAAAENVAQRKWRAFFDDPDLEALIEAALENSQELNLRMQEIIIAQNEVAAARGDYGPKVNAVAGAGVEKAGKYTRNGVVDEAHGLPKNLGDFSFGLQGSWEVDVWGKLRNAAKAANLRYMSSIEGKNFFVTQLVAEIARSYYDLLALDREIEILERNIAIQKQALEIVRLEKEAARATELAVQRFEAEVLKNESRLYVLEQERVQAENRINFLVGRYPQHVARNPKRLDEALPDTVETGVPSQLLENRPDVRQAELELEAAKLDVASAKAAFYPSLSVEAGAGYESFNLSHLLTTPESLVYEAAGHLTAPLLNRKAIEAHYRSANARQLQAVYSFERTLLQAYTDVANQLSVLENLKKSYDLQSRQVEKLRESVEVSNVLFQAARADYMEVLLTRRDSLDAETELVEKKKQLRSALVGLYQALGGGWRTGK